MKKKVSIIALVFGMFVLGSCKKDWVCECTLGSGDTTIVTTETIEGSSFRKAKQECEDKDATSFGSCKLKP